MLQDNARSTNDVIGQVGVERIGGGDRAGICVTQFDPKLLERGLVLWLY